MDRAEIEKLIAQQIALARLRKNRLQRKRQFAQPRRFWPCPIFRDILTQVLAI
ncbi:MAG TPA: hypothetical protein VHZ52_00725 [Acidobacteriaceae bacterium]|nr:hypothetical protein [Acidobacteriaceae bacterium]